MPSERRVVKRALEIYESNKDMYDILQLINSVLDNPQKWTVWYFIVQSMKGKERTLCRRMLAQMLQNQTTGNLIIRMNSYGSVQSHANLNFGWRGWRQ